MRELSFRHKLIPYKYELTSDNIDIILKYSYSSKNKIKKRSEIKGRNRLSDTICQPDTGLYASHTLGYLTV